MKTLDQFLGKGLVRVLPRRFPIVTPKPKRVLFVRPGGIGDAVLLLPTILHLRQLFPLVKVEVLAEKRNADVFRINNIVDKVFQYDSCADVFSLLTRRYDVVIDTEQWHRLSAVLSRFIRTRFSIGFGTNERARMFNCPISYSQEMYEADNFLRLLSPLGGKGQYRGQKFLELDRKSKLRFDAELSSMVRSPYVVIFPGASIPERRWGSSRFSRVAKSLSEQGYSVVSVGGQEDFALCEEILEHSVGVNLAGKTSLLETAVIIDGADLLVSGDSGILHLAVGLGVPTVSLFGPGIAAKWAPRWNRHRVLNKYLECSPCTVYGYTPECQIDAACLQDITVDEVVEAAKNLLENVGVCE